MAQLCLGDAAAELAGRRWGADLAWPRPCAQGKTVVGSAAFVVAAFFGSVAALWLVDGVLQVADPAVLVRLFGVSVGCAGVEIAPREALGDDNLSIFATAVALCYVLFGEAAF